MTERQSLLRDPHLRTSGARLAEGTPATDEVATGGFLGVAIATPDSVGFGSPEED